MKQIAEMFFKWDKVIIDNMKNKNVLSKKKWQNIVTKYIREQDAFNQINSTLHVAVREAKQRIASFS